MGWVRKKNKECKREKNSKKSHRSLQKVKNGVDRFGTSRQESCQLYGTESTFVEIFLKKNKRLYNDMYLILSESKYVQLK